jgi:hypothetical protein
MLREVFERAGFIVCAEAQNGAEAILQAEKCKPDLKRNSAYPFWLWGEGVEK